jgi:hypothetical protein
LETIEKNHNPTFVKDEEYTEYIAVEFRPQLIDAFSNQFHELLGQPILGLQEK